MEASKELGWRLHLHSCSFAVNHIEKSVSTVAVGLEPGWSSSTAYEGQRRDARSGTKRRPTRRQLGSLLRQTRRQQGQGSSLRSKRRQQGPITLKLYCPPGLVCTVPCSRSPSTSGCEGAASVADVILRSTGPPHIANKKPPLWGWQRTLSAESGE